jgi:hypothetical protein
MAAGKGVGATGKTAPANLSSESIASATPSGSFWILGAIRGRNLHADAWYSRRLNASTKLLPLTTGYADWTWGIRQGTTAGNDRKQNDKSDYHDEPEHFVLALLQT